ncbi:hypothetical protein AVHY2522_13660 [Acidovorax sp. SUPP2522]|uniref:Arc family DNA-binding protein n=1 Tax=unclassified Acidovorax TaxID=2684926 RepID=UPI00234B2974|nr:MULTISPECIES: Arc family DNA-binding protein [unclassified Acidovorax]WCM96264.1 Arc family DNA-binding protein [Acidovorax sp. GBBC 1281]GKT16990.1 hypothetical protein AVHY2522_13660 [Acidovorax sp. SUPP2522]
MSREDPQMKIRLPEALKARIEASAQAGGRSMNSEIAARLQQTFEKVAVDEGRLIALEAEADAQRALAKQFRAVAEMSDDVRTLLATILLSTLSRIPVESERDEEDRRLAKSTAEWLSERDQRGAVHSLLKIIDGSDAGKVELLRNFASHLEDLDDSAPSADLDAPMKKVIIVGNIGRLMDAREERFGLLGEGDPATPQPRQYGPQRSTNARKPKP